MSISSNSVVDYIILYLLKSTSKTRSVLSVAMSVRGTYKKIADAERDVLVKHYNAGMTSIAEAYTSKITEAANEAGISIQRVKVCII